MKKTFFLTIALVLLCGASFRAEAQDADAVLDRYGRVSGFDGVDLTKTAVMTRLKVSAMGLEIPCTSIVAPGDRMRAEMTVNGQKVELVVSDGKGWMSVPGAGVQPIPEQQLAQMSGQYDFVSSLKWNKDEYDLTLLPALEEKGKQYDGVRAVPKEPSEIQYSDIYFDHLTGLLAFMDVPVEAAGQKVTVRTVFSQYKTSASGVKYPSQIKATMDGAPVSTVLIEALEMDYPVTDEMFAQPK